MANVVLGSLTCLPLERQSLWYKIFTARPSSAVVEEVWGSARLLLSRCASVCESPRVEARNESRCRVSCSNVYRRGQWVCFILVPCGTWGRPSIKCHGGIWEPTPRYPNIHALYIDTDQHTHSETCGLSRKHAATCGQKR